MMKFAFAIIAIVALLIIFGVHGFAQHTLKSPVIGKAAKDMRPERTKNICVTFDDLPAERIYGKKERKQINDAILAALKKHNIPAAGFVIGDNVEGDWAIVVKWLENGNTIGFMPYSGQEFEIIPIDMFIDDIAKGMQTIENIVSSYNQDGRYFRFPFLNYGADRDDRLQVLEFLHVSEVSIAHASVVAEDFVYDLSLEKMINSSDSSKFAELCEEYINHILERLADAESSALEIMNRPIRQIMTLHANQLNAMFLDQIISAIADKGYNFISLKEALQDNVYQKEDAYYGKKGVSFLERIKLSNPDLIPASEE